MIFATTSLAGALLFAGVVHAEEFADEMATLDSLAIEENQSLRAYDARARSHEAGADFQEQRWPDPTVQYMADVSAPWMPRFTTGHSVSISQALPRPGARESQAAPLRASEAIVGAEKAETTAEILRDLRVNVVEIARLEAQSELLNEEIGLIDDAVAIVESLMAVGDAEHADLLQLEVAREMVVHERDAIPGEKRARLAAIAANIGGDLETVEAMEIPPEILEEWFMDLPSRDELVEMALAGEPGFARLEAKAEKASAEIDLVDERFRPWPMVMLGYSNMPAMWDADGPRSQMFQVGLSISLPLFGGQYDHEASQWEATRQSVEFDRAQLGEDVRADVEALISEWNADFHRMNHHATEVLPLAEDLSDEELIGVELGERTAAEFLLAVQQENKVERSIVDLRAELLKRTFELQRLTGGTLGAEQPWAYPSELGGEQ